MSRHLRGRDGVLALGAAVSIFGYLVTTLVLLGAAGNPAGEATDEEMIGGSLVLGGWMMLLMWGLEWDQ